MSGNTAYGFVTMTDVYDVPYISDGTLVLTPVSKVLDGDGQPTATGASLSYPIKDDKLVLPANQTSISVTQGSYKVDVTSKFLNVPATFVEVGPEHTVSSPLNIVKYLVGYQPTPPVQNPPVPNPLIDYGFVTMTGSYTGPNAGTTIPYIKDGTLVLTPMRKFFASYGVDDQYVVDGKSLEYKVKDGKLVTTPAASNIGLPYGIYKVIVESPTLDTIYTYIRVGAEHTPASPLNISNHLAEDQVEVTPVRYVKIPKNLPDNEIIILKNGSFASAPVTDLRGPAGPQGPQGPKGATGAPGAPGAPGKDGKDGSLSLASGNTLYACDPKYGLDNTGVADCTVGINRIISEAKTLGIAAIVFGAGIFRVAPPFFNIHGYLSIVGSGVGSTFFLIDSSKVTASTVENGVFHTGTYNTRIQDPSMFRVTLRDFGIITSYKNGGIPRSGTTGALQHIPPEEMNDKVWGITFNTFLGAGPADPDAVCIVENIEIWDTCGGMAYLGLDDQGFKTKDIRIRRTGKQGLLVGKPADHPEAFEANPTDPLAPYRRSGAADNKFINVDVSSANLFKNGYAGIEVHTSQCKFINSTSWYNKRAYAGATDLKTLPTGDEVNIWNLTPTKVQSYAGQVNASADPNRFAKDGAGWYIDGRDNNFISCTAQENGGHGFLVHGKINTFTDCRGESSSFYDSVSGNALGQEAAGFLITEWSWGSRFSGCIVNNAYPNRLATKVGFYIKKGTKQVILRDCRTYELPVINKVVYNYLDGGSLGSEVYVEVDEYFFSNFKRDRKGSIGPALLPSEISSLSEHWDFSDTSKIEVLAGRVSTVTPVTTSLLDGDLKQPDGARQPILTSINGKTGIKTDHNYLHHLQIANIGSVDILNGWTLVIVASINNVIGTQYLYSSYSAGSLSPASITVNNKWAVRANSGGATNGYTVQSSEGSVVKYQPSVIVAVTTKDGVELWLDGVKQEVSVITTGLTTTLTGKATIGAYNDGSSGASASFGEVMIFKDALTDEEISGLTTHLKGKWS